MGGVPGMSIKSTCMGEIPDAIEVMATEGQ